MELITSESLIYLYLLGVMLFAGIVHGSLGIGFPMVSTPLIAVFLDVRLAILMTLLPTVAVNVATIASGTDQMRSIKDYAPMFLGAIAGSIIGAWMLATMDPSPFRLALALLIILYLFTGTRSSKYTEWLPHHNRTIMCGFGLTAGISGGITNVMVAILIIYFMNQSMARSKILPIFNICFLIGKVTQLVILSLAGWVNLNLIYQSLLPAIVALCGLWAGTKIGIHISKEIYKNMLHVLLVILAIVLITQFILTLTVNNS
ncbi:MAG: sulfite exporter TauE/SafE family protein [Gammaproteobacteria bacterium]|nr:sulfite exporter TauE/SafE family protein [Gammaproteobacteria bacterium]MCY4219595.1 sulfite exporter TauE/SafE family protein [Gammaproteobacteria bacterium]